MTIHLKKGFTLIEAIIYIGLFSILIGTALVAAYQLIDGSGDLSTKNIVQEEGNFVLRKINYVMIGASNFSIQNGDELLVTKYDGTKVSICLQDGKIKIWKGGGSAPPCGDVAFLPLTTDNVEVTDLQFTQINANPLGVLVLAKIRTANTNTFDFTITKYIRQ